MLNEHEFRQAVWETYYDSYFQELVCDMLSRRWEAIDGMSAVLIAMSTSGSAVAGWALWTSPAGRPVWALIAGTSSIVAITHGSLRVAERVKRWEQLRRTFATLRVQLDTVRLNINIIATIESEKEHFDDLRKEYERLISDAPNDLAITERARMRAQDRLDTLLRQRGYV